MLDKKYNHKDTEKNWQKYWQDNQIHKWQNNQPKENTFVIDTPPPTVSGLLHMGHVFSYTQADFIARFQRMIGKDVFYPMGYDDNGLPTERLVEKVKKIRANQMPRQEFITQCQEIVEEAEIEFEVLFNSIALSVDWDQKYQTISEKSQKLSQSSFVDLYKKGLVEKKFAPVIWDVADQTALSQADLEDKKIPSKANFINFKSEDGKEIEIMTTRPELLPACVALLLNPKHPYAIEINASSEGKTGKFAYSTLFNAKVPIIIDNDVKIDDDKESNVTGAVMCCTFGDETDVNWWRKYNLELKIIINSYGKLLKSEDLDNLETKEIYDEILANKKIKIAREEIINHLNKENLLTRPSKEIIQNKKTAERSGTEVEFITTNQWYIKLLPFKEQLIEQIKKCNWNPDFMKVRAIQWCENLTADWCISRQRFFGVPFPVWQVQEVDSNETQIIAADFDELPLDPNETLPKGYEFVSESEDKSHKIAKKDGKEYKIFPETDIMDTWATSSVSPQLSSGLISDEMVQAIASEEEKQRHKKLFPADLRPQAHEIIRTWAFYTIAKAFLHEKQIPWKNLMISGWCLAADKTKMSKSKGNVVTPTSLIEEKGSDIVRYWTSTSHLGADTAYSEEIFKIGQKLITKLFNAAKFASMNFDLVKDFELPIITHNNTSDQKTIDDFFSNITESADLWILSKLKQTIEKSTAQFEKFEYAKAREIIEDFFWNDLCDNYLEIVKVRSYGLNAQKLENIELNDEQRTQIQKQQISAILTLKITLNTILKLFAPFIPHLCEEIYSKIFTDEFEKTKSINAIGSWPKPDLLPFDENHLQIGQEALKAIDEVRKFKSNNNLSMKTTIEKIEISSKIDLNPTLEDLKNVCNATNISLKNGDFNCKIES